MVIQPPKEEKITVIGERHHEMNRCEKEIFCPLCGAKYVFVKRNGNGYYRCKKCYKEIFIKFIKQK